VTRLPVLFVHGAGGAGPEAWPAQRTLEGDRTCWFLDRLAPGDPPRRVVEHVVARLDGPVHVVAHSYGALAAVLIAQQWPDLVASLVLVEPALLHLSRGRPLTEQHVADLEPVFSHADDPEVDGPEFSRRFAEASGWPPPQGPEHELAEHGRHLRDMAPPWTFEVDEAFVRSVSTLVAIGGAGSMFAEVADALAEVGARVSCWPGTGHRPHDSAEFTDALRDHWRAVEGGQPAST
jgi:pimeloyl-ACP methyl ester carboxylesterase